jgi:hypothetical protein
MCDAAGSLLGIKEAGMDTDLERRGDSIPAP